MKDGQTQHRSKVRVRVNPNLRHRSLVPEKRPGRQSEEETNNSYNDDGRTDRHDELTWYTGGGGKRG